MEDEEFYYVSLYDGICDQTKQLGKPGKKLLTKKMQNDEKWVISSSGSHMFVNFAVDILMTKPGFTAKIHYGNMINDIKSMHRPNIDLFSVNCSNVMNGKIGFCACHSCSEHEGDCESRNVNQCRKGLKCGSNNCPASFGFDNHTDCCYDAIVGSEDFCTMDEPCKVDEGDCDSDDECESHLFCGSNNCLDSLGSLNSVECCEPKGDNIILVMFRLILSI